MAKHNGLSLKGILSETFFVPRSTAERWLDEAERKFLEREHRGRQANL